MKCRTDILGSTARESMSMFFDYWTVTDQWGIAVQPPLALGGKIRKKLLLEIKVYKFFFLFLDLMKHSGQELLHMIFFFF